MQRVSFLTPEEREHVRAGGLLLFKSHVPSVRGGYWRRVVLGSPFSPRVPTPDMVVEAERIMRLPENRRPQPAPLPPKPPRLPRLPRLPQDVRKALSTGSDKRCACVEGLQRRNGYQQGLTEGINSFEALRKALKKLNGVGNGLRGVPKEIGSKIEDLRARKAQAIAECKHLQDRLQRMKKPLLASGQGE